MIFDGKPTNQITADDLRSLVTDGVREDQFVDFKRVPYPPSDAGKRELLKDVTAFANAAGGYILIGVDENGEHRASELVGVVDAERVRRSMLDRCLTLIDPRLIELDIGIITVEENRIVVCRVPESPKKPHAAVPDREHHYFWLRYEDGVKLMTIAEIRDAVAGDAVQREVASLRQELIRQRTRETALQEMELEVDEQGLRELESPAAFAHHTERLFREQIGDRPYFRLAATPMPPNQHHIGDHREALIQLIANPPLYREHGWDVGAHGLGPRPRQTGTVLQVGGLDYHHLRLYMNGHLEFWTPADDDSFSWGMDEHLPPPQRTINPLAFIEATASFVRLAERVWGIAEISGEAEFRLMIHRIRGRRVPPYANQSRGRMFGIPGADQTMGVFQEDDVRIGPVRVPIADLPGTVAFRLVSEVYYHIGYIREHIPYFDDQDRYMDDARLNERQVGGAE